MEIDIQTLIIILGITHLMQVLVFYHQYRVNKAYRGIGWWLLWSGAEVVGFGVMLLRNITSILPLIIIIQNVMIISGTLFLYIGIKRFFNKTINTKLVISILTVYIFGLLYFLFIKNDIQFRSSIFSAILALVAFLTSYSLFSDKTKNVVAAANFNALIFLIHGGIFVYRFFMIASGTEVAKFFTPTLFNVIPYFDAIIVSLLWTFGLIIMLNQRLNAEMFEVNRDLQLIFNTSPDAAMITRLEDGFIYDINEGFTHITGYSREEIVGKSVSVVNLWKNINDRQKIVLLLKENGFCENFEALFTLKDGTEINGLISAKIINLHDIPHIISITRDITERRRLEEEFKESELRFSSMFENMSEGVAMHEVIYNENAQAINYRIINANHAFETLTNISAKEAKGKLATELYEVETAPYINDYEKVVKSGKPLFFETHFDKTNKDFSISVISTKPGHFATIFSDITARKQKETEISSLLKTSENSRENLLSILEDQMRVEESLRTSEERYRSLLTNLEVGIVVHAPDTSIIGNNKKANELLGLSEDQMIGKLAIDPYWKFIHEDGTDFQLEEYPVNQIITTKKPIKNLILAVVRSNSNDIAWLTVNGFPVFDINNNITEILISFIEITEKVKAEIELRDSEKTFSEMFHKSPVTIMLSVPFEGTIVDINESFQKDMEYSRSEVIGHTPLELELFNNSDDRAKLVEILKDKKSVFGYECQFRSKSGKVLTGLISIVFVTIKGKTLQLSTILDIDERKKAEKALKDNNIFLQTLLNAIPAPVFYKNTELQFTGFNRAFEDFYGRTTNEILGKTVFETYPKHLAKIAHDKDLELLEHKGSQIYESQAIDFTGNVHEVVYHKAPIIDTNGEIQGLIGVSLDITERKQAEIKLRDSEERYRSTLDNMMEGCQIIDFNWRYIYINQAAVYHARINKEQLLNHSMLEIYPDIVGTKLYNLINSCMNDRLSYNLENEFIYNDKSKAWFELSIQPVNEGVFVLSIDITERKRAEYALRASEEKYRELINGMNETVWVIDINGNIIDANNTAVDVLGYTKEELFALSLNGIDSSLNKEEIKTLFSIMSADKLQIFDTTHKCKDGRTFPVEVYSSLVEYHGKKAILSIARDITDRRKSEEIIKSSEIRYRRLFESAKDGILILDAETGQIKDANPYIKEMLGFSRDELIGKELWEIGLFKDIIASRDSFIELKKNEYIRYDDLPLETISGKIKYVEFVSNVYKVGEQNVVQCNIRDISERKQAEEALAWEKYLVYALLENIPSAVYFKDLESRYIRISKFLANQFGLDNPIQAVGKSDFDFFTKERAMETLKDEQNIMKTCFPLITEEQETWSNRPNTWVNTTKLPLFDKEGNIIGTFGISMDITNRKLAEDALRQSEKKFRRLLEMVPMPICYANQQGEITFRNERFVKLIGYTEKDVPGIEEWWIKAYPDKKYRERVIKNWEKAVTKAKNKNLDIEPDEYMVVCKDGNTRNFIISGIIIEEYLLIILIDITERKKAELEIQKLNIELEQRVTERTAELLDLYNNAPCGYHSFNKDGLIELINDTELNWIGYQRDEIQGLKNISDIITDDSKEIIAESFPKFRDSGVINNIELDMVRKDGSILPILLSATSIVDKNGAFLKGRSTLIDNTERKKAEKAIQETQELLKASNKELEAFAYSVSHDLRAPLRHITGFIRLFLDQKTSQLSSHELDLLNTVSSSAENMGKLIDALLTFSRLNQAELQKNSFVTSQVIEQLLEFYSHEVKTRSIEIVTKNLPDTFGDSQLIAQVWTNLISNAIKYTAKKEQAIIEIGGYCEDNETIFYIKDNGAGFDMKYVDKLFGVFQRLHKARDFEGIGIGLANIKRIVTRHGGSCWAEGEIDKGAVFYFSLPIN
jgi:PAS domain S-box-containing protein